MEESKQRAAGSAASPPASSFLLQALTFSADQCPFPRQRGVCGVPVQLGASAQMFLSCFRPPALLLKNLRHRGNSRKGL